MALLDTEGLFIAMLVCTSCVSSTYTQCDIQQLEKVQKYFTKMIADIKNML